MMLCALKNTAADKCRFRRANFFKTPLKGTDLRTCDIAGATFSENLAELKGAKVSLLQAAALLRALGIDAE